MTEPIAYAAVATPWPGGDAGTWWSGASSHDRPLVVLW